MVSLNQIKLIKICKASSRMKSKHTLIIKIRKKGYDLSILLLRVSINRKKSSRNLKFNLSLISSDQNPSKQKAIQ